MRDEEGYTVMGAFVVGFAGGAVLVTLAWWGWLFGNELRMWLE